MNTIVNKQREYFYSGKTLEYDFRIKQLKCLKDSMKTYQQELLDAFMIDLHKCEFDVLATEYSMVVGEIDYMLKHLKKLMKVKKVRASITNFPAKGRIYPHPYGVTLIIAPWNYPLQLSMSPLVASMAAGNTCIVKPSEFSPNVSQVIKKILDVFDDSYICCILGGVEESQQLLEQRFDYIFYTGGDRVGRIVMEKASHNLTPVSLELGGKSPTIVDKTADIKIAAKRLAWGKYLNAGQTCVAPDYILIDECVKDEFIQEMIKYINEYYYVDGKISNNYCHIINEKHKNRLMGLLQQEKIIFGGKCDNLTIEPTIVEASFNDLIMQEEIFGPIFPIITYNNLNDVVDYLHSQEKPLALYIFSSSKKNIKTILDNCTFGGGCINDCIMHLTNENLPFGGVGRSGMGSYHGKKSFDTFTHYRSVLKKGRIEINIKYPPYNNKKLKLMKKVTKI